MNIQLRGTSGSGKSYCVHYLLNNLPGVRLIKNGKVQGYRLKHPNGGQDIYVVGSYENICGGLDGIKTQDGACARIVKYASRGNVIFEGLLASNVYQRWIDLSTKINGLIWAFMDTPLDVCLARIEARRKARNAIEPLNPANTISKHKAILTCAKKVLSTQETVIYLNHKNAYLQVFEMLTQGTIDGHVIKTGYRFEEGFKMASQGVNK